MSEGNQKALSPITKNNHLKPVEGRYSLIKKQEEFDQNYIMHRINLPSIEINAKMRDFIEQAMDAGKKFVRLGDHTVMINSIAGIDPLPKKIPKQYPDEIATPDGKYYINQKTGAKRKADL